MIISIIVPTLNEAGLIQPFLEHLRERATEAEIIVADACSSDGIGFFKECDWIQNDPSADYTEHSVVKYSGRNQVQDVAILSESDRVAGIVSALITGNTVEFPGEDVDDFAFAFISPLETYDS